MLETDLRLIKPSLRYNKFHNKDLYVVGCNVIEIGEKLSGRKHLIKIEVVNFKTGAIEVKQAITYTRTMEIFNDLRIVVPFRTEANVHIVKDKVLFEVYGAFNSGLFELFYDVKEILNYDESQIMDVFHSHYYELNKWVESRLESPDIDHEDLPF